MHIVVDAVGIRGHGGAAVLCELLHWLPDVRPNWQWHVFLLERNLREFDVPRVNEKVVFEFTRHGNSGMGRLLWVNSKLQKRVREIGADLIFSVANVGAHNPVVPQVLLVHQYNAFDSHITVGYSFLKRFRIDFLRRQILSSAKASKAVIVQTESMRDRVKKFEPSLSGRIQVIPSGYRTITTNPTVRKDVEEKILASSCPRLIYVSYPSEHKNHLNLLRSLPEMIKIWPSLNLILTLEADLYQNKRYDSFIEEIRRTSISLDVGKNVVFLGILTPDEVYYALSNCDVMVFPSLAESFGLGLAEALGAGCPIAASNLPYAHDVANGAAVYFDPKDPGSMARSCLSLLGNPLEIEKLKSEGRRLKLNYSYDNIAERFARVFESYSVTA